MSPIIVCLSLFSQQIAHTQLAVACIICVIACPSPTAVMLAHCCSCFATMLAHVYVGTCLCWRMSMCSVLCLAILQFASELVPASRYGAHVGERAGDAEFNCSRRRRLRHTLAHHVLDRYFTGWHPVCHPHYHTMIVSLLTFLAWQMNTIILSIQSQKNIVAILVMNFLLWQYEVDF